jgi:hypothetical protein
LTTRRDLVDAIRLELGAAVNPVISNQQTSSDLYEAYLLALVVRAAKAEGATVSYRTRTGATAADFVFRTAPGLINSSAQQYTFAHLDLGSRRGPLEVHIGVRISGKSRVLHEGDVIVLLESEAARARSRNLAPRSHAVLFLAEAKFYATSLPLGMARGFMGLCSDLSVKTAYLASNIDSREATRLLDARGHEYEPNLVPKSLAADHFVAEVRKVMSRHQRAS